MNAHELKHRAQVARTLLGTGMIEPLRPDKALRSLRTLHQWGPTPAAAYKGSAIRHPTREAIVDERGTLTFAEVDGRTNALAWALRRDGIGEQDGVAIMCRNHRGFIEATVACSKLGAGALYLNTAFAGPQIADVMRRENPVALIYDEEFDDLVAEGGAGRKRYVAWHDPGERPLSGSDPRLEELIAAEPDTPLSPPAEKGRVVILTSGTTGAPKGAARKQPDSLEPAAALFSKIPLKARETTMIAAPMFHSWGFAHFSLALPLASTLVLRRKFDPLDTLRAVAHHRATALAVVPVMLQRMLDLGDEQISR
jgi:acyl-CoA synthetase (AMP-forming)/AMP-acid ligase II